MDSTELMRAGREILAAALHQRIGAGKISRGMMMKGDRGLDEALQECFFQSLRFAPNVLPNFVGIIELARIEEANASMIAVHVHGHGLEYYPCGPQWRRHAASGFAELLGLCFIAPALGLAIDDGVTLTGRIF